MRDSAVIALFQRRLVQLGCPAGRLRDSVRELGEHHDDLKQSALEEGLSEPEAEARADELLGEPVSLAGQISAVLRQSSWFGRHPFITFCLLPFLAILIILPLSLGLEGLVSRLYLTMDEVSYIASDTAGLALLNTVVLGTWGLAILFIVAVFYRLARRTGSGLKWALATCLFCSLYSCFIGFRLEPHEFSLYCGFPPPEPGRNWLVFSPPLFMAVVLWLRQRQRLKLHPQVTLPEIAAPVSRPKLRLPRTGFITPSSVIAAVAVAGFVSLMLWARSTMMERMARDDERISTIWPAERAAVIQHLKSRQLASDVSGVTTVNLKPWLNAALADSLAGPADTNRDNLAALPSGVHIFGGVPFDIQGRVQLMGRKLLDQTTAFPVRVRNLPIAQKCSRIHLLHGANALDSDLFGTNIACLVLHYADGSQARIAIVAGANVRDWWGPIYKTGAGDNGSEPSASGSELAWAGTNPCIQDREPQSSLRLYQSTFANPRPYLEIVSMDYVSTVSAAAPFLVGLTLEP